MQRRRSGQALSKQVARIGSETRTLLALVAELQKVTQGSTGALRHTVAAVATQAGRVADAVEGVSA